MAHYIDTSAAAKFVVDEAESAALRAWHARVQPDLVASDLIRTELLRAAKRADDGALTRATRWLTTIEILPIGRDHFDLAGLLDPVDLRSLDALHLICALGLAEACDGIVTYDDRLQEAAKHHGIPVIAPS